MRFPLFIARRYLIARKSHNLINLIAGISLLATAAVSMAMVIILSAFNGLEGLVLSMFNTFSPELRITAVEGKVFLPDSTWQGRMEGIEGVALYTEVLEDNALFRYKSRQHIGRIKGVEQDYIDAIGLEESVYQGQAVLADSSGQYALLGSGVDYQLSFSLNDENSALAIYVPDRKARPSALRGASGYFRSSLIRGAGIFSIQPEIDNRYVLVPMSLARELLERDKEVSAIEILLRDDASMKRVQEEVATIAGPGFKVENRYQQQAFLYKVMRSEKWAIFLILSFILLIAAFNLIGSVTMLMLDKRQDIEVMRSMGATQNRIRRIFLNEGLLITLSGTLGGILLGILIVILQQQFGLVKLSGGTSFIVEAYPVKLKLIDLVFVSLTVAGIGTLASLVPLFKR